LKKIKKDGHGSRGSLPKKQPCRVIASEAKQSQWIHGIASSLALLAMTEKGKVPRNDGSTRFLRSITPDEVGVRGSE
jgi:hypothetical protein